jgi:hypothetical protein
MEVADSDKQQTHQLTRLKKKLKYSFKLYTQWYLLAKRLARTVYWHEMRYCNSDQVF